MAVFIQSVVQLEHYYGIGSINCYVFTGISIFANCNSNLVSRIFYVASNFRYLINQDKGDDMNNFSIRNYCVNVLLSIHGLTSKTNAVNCLLTRVLIYNINVSQGRLIYYVVPVSEEKVNTVVAYRAHSELH